MKEIVQAAKWVLRVPYVEVNNRVSLDLDEVFNCSKHRKESSVNGGARWERRVISG